MAWHICCGYFLCIRHLKNISTDELTEDNEVALCVPWETSPREQDRMTEKLLSACLKIYQVKWGSGHIGNDELTSPQFIKIMIWRENWKGLHKRDNSFTLKCLNETIKTVNMSLQSWILFSETSPCSAQQLNRCSFCKSLWNISCCPSAGHWGYMTFP